MWVTAAGSTGLSATGVYYVVNATSNTFQLAGLEGGAPVTIAATSTVALRLVGAFIMYYQQDMIATRDQQHTLYAYSREGLGWSRGGIALDGSTVEGVRHTGYARIFRLDNRWAAYHLLAGGAFGVAALSFSNDGLTWWTDSDPLYWDVNASGIGGAYDPDFLVAWVAARPFLWNGRYWTFVTSVPFGVFGGQSAPFRRAAQRRSPGFRRATGVMRARDDAPDREAAGGRTGEPDRRRRRAPLWVLCVPRNTDPNTNHSLASLALIKLDTPA